VSIGLPVYNGERLIGRAVDSLLTQDYSNFELIISDNCSTDQTPTICARYAEKDPRVRFSSNPRNLGCLPNFLRVLSLARGEYFMWAAHDDFWYPSFISALLEELAAHPDAGVAMSALERLTKDQAPHDVIRYGADDLPSPNELTSFQLFKRIQYLVPYHYFLYGLFRADFVKRLMRTPIPEVPRGDLIFMNQIALATRFRYRDEVLHVRTESFTRQEEKYPDDEHWARIYGVENSGHWKPHHELFALMRLLLRSQVIPWHRKVRALGWLTATHLDNHLFPKRSPIRWLHQLLKPQRQPAVLTTEGAGKGS
jgi:glycosyltransferase involved in cell wall biosynthesis